MSRQHARHFIGYQRIQQGILLGESGVGKTTLLDQAGLTPFDQSQSDILLKKETGQSITRWENHPIHLWAITPDWLEAETTPSKKKKTFADPSKAFSSLLKSHLNKRSIDFLILCFNASKIHSQLIQQWEPYLTSLAQYHRKKVIPVHIVLTHSDQLTGFEAYCHPLSDAVREHAWGVQLTCPTQPEQHHEAFSYFFDTLQRQTLAQLHLTYLPSRRETLIHFPPTIKRTLQKVEQLIHQCVATNPAFSVKGVYFTSNPADQPSLFTADLMQVISKNSTTAQSASIPFRKKIKHWRKQKSPWGATLAGLTLIISGWLSFSYYQLVSVGLTQTASALKALQQPATPTAQGDDPSTQLSTSPPPSPEIKLIHSMDGLQQALNQLKTLYQRYFIVAHFTQISPLMALIDQQYKKELSQPWADYLHTQLITALNNLPTPEPTVHNKLTYATIKQAQDHYRYLQAYFNLSSQPSTRWAHKAQLHTLFDTLWKTQPKNTRQALHHYLEAWLTYSDNIKAHAENYPIPPADQATIRSAQQKLQSYPAAILITMAVINTLEQEAAASPTPPSTIYTPYYAQTLNTQIEQAAQQLADGSSLFGKPIPSTPLDQQQARHYYFSLYQRYWNNQLKKLTTHLTAQLLTDDRLSPIQQVQAASNMLNTLLDKNSDYHQRLKALAQQVAPQPDSADFNQEVSQHFTALGVLLSDLEQQKNAYSFLKNTYDLLRVLEGPETTSQPRLALQMAKTHMTQTEDPLSQLKQYATTQAPPISHWLEDIEVLAWRGLLDLSRQAMNTAWQATVWPEYQQQLAGRYPLVKKASRDVTLEAFSHFFGPQGQLQHFYETYMADFIDKKTFYWVWKNKEGYHLAIPPSVVELFMRGELIRKMYFPKGHATPFARFALLPKGLMPSIRQLHWRIDHRAVDHLNQPHTASPLVFTWPDQAHQKIKVAFLDNQGKIVKLIKTGPWAWFKLLDASDWHPTQNLQRYTLLIDVNGNSAKYDLLTRRQLSPLSLDILPSFRCPETL